MSRDAFASLAATAEPTLLVQGDVGSVETFADALAGFSSLVLDAASSMARVDAHWRGAAGASFWERMTAATRDFRRAGDAFAEAAVAIRRYAWDLADAQSTARLAAARWADGVRAAAEASANAVPFGSMALSGPTQELALRWEPAGAAERAAAAVWLEQAWDQQDGSATRAAAVLARAMEAAPEAARWYETMAPTLLGLTLMRDSRQKRELAVGSGRGLVDLALAGGNNQWGTTDVVNQSLDRWERDQGLNPRSGIHETARFVAPIAVPIPGLGLATGSGRVAARLATQTSRVVPDGLPLAYSAESAADVALAAGRETGGAAELVIGGRVFRDLSSGGSVRALHVRVKEALDAVPADRRAPWHGECAEMGCLSQALSAGVDPTGGSAKAVAIGRSKPGHGLPKKVCTSCSHVLENFGVRH